jgi:hypothetical protein
VVIGIHPPTRLWNFDGMPADDRTTPHPRSLSIRPPRPVWWLDEGIRTRPAIAGVRKYQHDGALRASGRPGIFHRELGEVQYLIDCSPWNLLFEPASIDV